MYYKRISITLLFMLVFGISQLTAQSASNQHSNDGEQQFSNVNLHVINAQQVGDQLHLRLGGRTVGAGAVVSILERNSDGQPLVEYVCTLRNSRDFIIINLTEPEAQIGPRSFTVIINSELVEFEI